MTDLERAHAAIGHLRSAAKKIVEAAGEHTGICHCPFCDLRHALAVTSGFAHLDEPKWPQDDGENEILRRPPGRKPETT